MIRYVNKIIYLLNGSVKEVPYLVLIFLIMSVLDVLGIALIVPYVDLITSSTFPETGNIFTKLLTKYSSILTDDLDSVVVFISKVLILIFLIKAIVAIYINYRIISCNNYFVIIRRKSKFKIRCGETAFIKYFH